MMYGCIQFLFFLFQRLIVEFSLENRSALRTKQERVERSKVLINSYKLIS